MDISSIFEAIEDILSRPYEQVAAHANEFIRILERDISKQWLSTADETTAKDLLARLRAQKAKSLEAKMGVVFIR